LKNQLVSLLILFIVLVGCNVDKDDEIKGKIDKQGVITKIDINKNRILVKEKNAELIWVSLDKIGNIKNYEEGQDVAVWIDGEIAESSPAQGKALNIEVID
jgi:hypothetical protein